MKERCTTDRHNSRGHVVPCGRLAVGNSGHCKEHRDYFDALCARKGHPLDKIPGKRMYFTCECGKENANTGWDSPTWNGR